VVKKLTKHGNSFALVIDRPILELLNIDPETPLDVSTDGKQLIVAPAKASERRKKFEDARKLSHKRYGKAFRKLAERVLGPTVWNPNFCRLMKSWKSMNNRSNHTAAGRDFGMLLAWNRP
jgi:antitoxin component of MazEF toxin-antitoxin module